MSRPVRLYPYAFASEITLRLSEFDDPIRGETVTVAEVGQQGDHESESGRLYDASGDGANWKKLSFRLTAEMPAEALEVVLPPTSDTAQDTVLNVLITCPSTKFRHGARLRMVRDGLWTGHAILQRADVASGVVFQPQLVRATSIPSEEELPYAKRAGSIIGLGEPVTLLLAPRRQTIQSSVDVRWEDFGNSDNPWRRERVEDVYHLEPFTEPRLFLNSRYSQLREIMESTAKQGPEAALRDMAAALIAQPVLLQMAVAAVASMETDEDSSSMIMPSGWRKDLLDSLLPRLYPEEADDELRARRAAVESRDADGAVNFAARLGSAVQETIASYKTIESAIRAYESMREQEELVDA